MSSQHVSEISSQIDELWALTSTESFFSWDYMNRALSIEASIRGHMICRLIRWLQYWYYAILDQRWSAIFLYRLSVYHKSKGKNGIAKLLHRLNLMLNGCDISAKARIAPPCLIQHSTGIIVGSGTVIGPYCQMHGNCVFGRDPAEFGGEDSYPRVGRGVFVGSGAVLIGGIKIEDDVVIGALTKITFSVPENSIVSGPTAKIKRLLGSDEDPALRIRRRIESLD